MQNKDASPFTVILGVLFLLFMGINALDGEISGNLLGKNGPPETITVTSGPLVVFIGWLFIFIAVFLTIRLIQILWKKKK